MNFNMTVPQVPGVVRAASYYNQLTKAGPFLFLAGMIAYDPDTKKVIKNIWDLPEEGRKALETGRDHTDHREGRIMAQTWFIYNSWKKTLESQGSSLDNIVWANYYFIHLDRDFAPFERVRMMFIKKELSPPGTGVEVLRVGVNDDCILEMNCIGVIPNWKGD